MECISLQILDQPIVGKSCDIVYYTGLLSELKLLDNLNEPGDFMI